VVAAIRNYHYGDRLTVRLTVRGLTVVTEGTETEAEILLLVGDTVLQGLIVAFLSGRPVTIASTPDEAAGLLSRHRYRLFIATNFGVNPRDALAVIPRDRDYPVLFLTGSYNEDIADACAEKEIPLRTVPISPKNLVRELRIALDDPRLAQ
jgi:hypothetical protein